MQTPYIEFDKAWDELKKCKSYDLYNEMWDFYYRITKYANPNEWDKCTLLWNMSRWRDTNKKIWSMCITCTEENRSHILWNDRHLESLVMVKKHTPIKELCEHQSITKRVIEGRTIKPQPSVLHSPWNKKPFYQVKIGTMPGTHAVIKRHRKFYPGMRVEFAEIEQLNGMRKSCSPRWQTGVVQKVEFDRIFIDNM